MLFIDLLNVLIISLRSWVRKGRKEIFNLQLDGQGIGIFGFMNFRGSSSVSVIEAEKPDML